WNLVPDANCNLTIHLHSADGTHIFSSASPSRVFPIGIARCVCRVPSNLLNDGQYRVTLMIVKDRSTQLFTYENAIAFEIHDTRREHGWLGKWPGAVRPDLPWHLEHLGNTVAKTRVSLS